MFGANYINLIFFSALLISVFITNPLVLCLSLMFLSFMLGALVHQAISLWMMNALVLVFLGGMMVLFLYISILSNNEKLVIPQSLGWLSSSAFALLLGSLYLGLDTNQTFNLPDHSLNGGSLSDLGFIYCVGSISYLGFLVVMLLTSLFLVVKLTESFKGSLAKSSYS